MTAIALLSLLVSCANEPAPIADPTGLPLEIDMGSFNIRAGSATGKIVGVVVVNSGGTVEDFYLSPAGASGNYAAYINPSAGNPSTTLFYQYVNNSTTVPPTNPAPAPSAVHKKHTVSDN